MQRLSAGHDAALNDLMSRHSERLYQFLLRALQNPNDAADLAEETFVRVYQNAAKFDVRKKFSTWLFAIAANLARDRYRWRQRHPEISLDQTLDEDQGPREWPDTSPSPGERVETAERAEAVRRAIAALPEEMRTALILSEYEDMSHAEIAQVIGCSAKAVEVRLYRARQLLRKKLAGLLA